MSHKASHIRLTKRAMTTVRLASARADPTLALTKCLDEVVGER
jgi:hypothetical protein